MFILEKLKLKAKKLGKRIVFPEGFDDRTLFAAETLRREEIVEPLVLGDQDSILQRGKKLGLNLEGINMVSPGSSDRLENYASQYFEKMESKGVTRDEARKQRKWDNQATHNSRKNILLLHQQKVIELHCHHQSCLLVLPG